MSDNNFVIKSIKERIGLDYIIPELFKDKLYSSYYTDIYGKEIYDAFIQEHKEELFEYNGVVEKHKGITIKRFLIEVKVRDDFYLDGLMLEYKKLNDLKKKAKNVDATIIYISITPNGTYCFNLSKMENNFKWETKNCPISTVDPSRGRVDKKVVMLKLDTAKFINLKTDFVNKRYDESIDVRRVKNDNNETKARFCLFRDVLNM